MGYLALNGKVPAEAPLDGRRVAPCFGGERHAVGEVLDEHARVGSIASERTDVVGGYAVNHAHLFHALSMAHTPYAVCILGYIPAYDLSEPSTANWYYIGARTLVKYFTSPLYT